MNTAEQTLRRPNGHSAHRGIGVAESECPYCGQPISRKEFREIQTRMRDEERARVAEVERGLQEKFARESAKAEATKKSEIDKAKRDAAKAAEEQVKALKATLDATIAERLVTQQEAADKRLTEAVAAERTKAYGERMQLDAQLADLQRRLQRRTANELGETGEVDLFEVLVTEFPADQITRVGKGVNGPDIVHRVFSGGAFTGRSIIYDSKNHKNWMSKWLPKLRRDQTAYGADHAVLVSTVMPAGRSQLMVENGVVVCSPARAAAIAHMLRRAILQIHALGLSNADRDAKTARLYDLLTSDRATERWERLSSATTELVDIETSDAAHQQRTRDKRLAKVRSIASVHDEFVGDVDAIVRGEPEDLL